MQFQQCYFTFFFNRKNLSLHICEGKKPGKHLDHVSVVGTAINMLTQERTGPNTQIKECEDRERGRMWMETGNGGDRTFKNESIITFSDFIYKRKKKVID